MDSALLLFIFFWWGGETGTQEEAAEAYDIAAIKFRGLNAVTNFDMSRYDVKSIANSNLPIGGMSGKSKNSSESASDSKSIDGSRSDDRDLSSASSITFASQPSTSSLSFAIPIKQDPSDYWSILGYHNSSFNNAKNNNNPSAGFQSTTSPFNMDFSAASSSANESSGGIFNGGYIQQQNNGTSIPFATPIALSSNNSYESSSGYGSSWIGPALHTFQTHAKPSLFQTPIFGIE
jgi:AP2-like factor (ANT lineage)